MKTIIISLMLFALNARAQTISFNLECVGAVFDAATSRQIGSAFIWGKETNLVTCAHVAQITTNMYYDSVSESNAVRRVTMKYILPRHDLAVLTLSAGEYAEPLIIGDIRRVRPGDNVIYAGARPGSGSMEFMSASISAIGTVLNDGATVEFIEFEGGGVPGFSGGPVFDISGKVVAVMREAWMKRGVKGGPEVLINRAFSVGVLGTLDDDVFSSAPAIHSSQDQRLSLLEASGMLEVNNHNESKEAQYAPTAGRSEAPRP